MVEPSLKHSQPNKGDAPQGVLASLWHHLVVALMSGGGKSLYGRGSPVVIHGEYLRLA